MQPDINTVPPSPTQVLAVNAEKKATHALTLGIIGMFAWLIPLFGFPITIIGILFGVKALNSSQKNKAIVGVTLSVIGLVLTIANAAIGAYMGATGQHPLVNEIIPAQNQDEFVLDSAMPTDTSDTTAKPEEKIKADTFTGTLEKVDTGCFADGECYVEVDGKHITALRGWSQDEVGSVLGVEGFGDLEGYIGKEVEVYAQNYSDGTYTLYGSEGFYIKVK